jgi:hypothetical protein
MRPFEIIQQVVQGIPAPVQGSATGVSLFTLAAAFLEQIHGPVVTIGAILGACWIGMQMVNMALFWIEKIRTWRSRKGK